MIFYDVPKNPLIPGSISNQHKAPHKLIAHIFNLIFFNQRQKENDVTLFMSGATIAPKLINHPPLLLFIFLF
jgi:hypothetical protein